MKSFPHSPLATETFPRDRVHQLFHCTHSSAGAGYTVPLNQVAINALKALLKRSPDGTGPVIRKPSGLELYSSRKWFENCLKAAAITNFRWHDLRHTFATRLRRAGTSIARISACFLATEPRALPNGTHMRIRPRWPRPLRNWKPAQKPAHPLLLSFRGPRQYSGTHFTRLIYKQMGG